jgi:hypothetical protein
MLSLVEADVCDVGSYDWVGSCRVEPKAPEVRYQSVGLIEASTSVGGKGDRYVFMDG